MCRAVLLDCEVSLNWNFQLHLILLDCELIYYGRRTTTSPGKRKVAVRCADEQRFVGVLKDGLGICEVGQPTTVGKWEKDGLYASDVSSVDREGIW